LFRHEIVGEVTEVGSEVKAFKVGEIVGVGCLVNSCQTCDPCTQHLEQYCGKKVWTYTDKDYDGTITQGGYSTIMVCRQEYVILILLITLILLYLSSSTSICSDKKPEFARKFLASFFLIWRSDEDLCRSHEI
jgi:threonine dehydrogenase-like Zn-dependent dehydrogenase